MRFKSIKNVFFKNITNCGQYFRSIFFKRDPFKNQKNDKTKFWVFSEEFLFKSLKLQFKDFFFAPNLVASFHNKVGSVFLFQTTNHRPGITQGCVISFLSNHGGMILKITLMDSSMSILVMPSGSKSILKSAKCFIDLNEDLLSPPCIDFNV